MEYYVITFSNTHGAISGEKFLKAEFPIVVMPAPRDVSKGCGIAVRFNPGDLQGILKRLESFPIDKKMYSIHHYCDGCYTLVSM
ncbi:MAG: DUF3343 domain-containing protein [Eubacteriales bacterium]|nr:DUF3343 domain-containing protein [Eubacteriales bacterium]